MIRLIFAAVLLSAPLNAEAQPMPDPSSAQRLQQLEDRAALKDLVDTFSNLADRKDVQNQVLLFTPDATVESYSDGKLGSSFTGRNQIAQAFAGFLGTFEVVYHINGQQTVEITGNRATGTAYCLVVLIGLENGKRFRTTSGVIYNDSYVRLDGRWLISRRASHFTWRDREEMGPQP